MSEQMRKLEEALRAAIRAGNPTLEASIRAAIRRLEEHPLLEG